LIVYRRDRRELIDKIVQAFEQYWSMSQDYFNGSDVTKRQ
jgi:hypothetical protein